MTLRDQVFGSVRWTSLSSLLRVGLFVGQYAILARLLSPRDFGLMAPALSLVVFLETFADAGVSNAIIHRQETDQHRLSSLYWLNIAAGTGVAVLLALASPFMAAFYGEPALQPLIALAALHLILGASWQQLLVRAEMDLRFGALSLVQVSASVVGIAASILIAWRGGGAYALVGGLLFQSAAGAALGWLLLSQGWRPERRLRPDEIAPHLSFGAYAMGNNVANSLSSQIDVLLGGRLLGAQALGEYSVSRNLCLQPAAAINPIVTRVGLPVMARTNQDLASLKSVYLQTVRMTASVNIPIYAALALFAPEVVGIVFGSQWRVIVPLVQLFALWGMMRALINPVGSLLLACGRADLSLSWNLGLLALAIPAAWIGSHYGQWGLAVAMTLLVAGAFVPHWAFLVRPLCGAGFGEYALSVAMPLALAAVSMLPAYAAVLPLEAAVPRLAIGVLTGAATYILLSAAFNRVWMDAMRDLLKIRR